MDKESLWKAVLGELEVVLSASNFHGWVKQANLVSEESGSILISIPNIFTKKWFEDKYQKEILAAFKNVLGTVKSIEYVVGEHKSVNTETESAHPVLEITPVEIVTTEGGLNPKYDFDNFVVGNSNKLAHAVARSVAKSPGAEYNPLFIYGGSGLGKTHLMQAIGNAILKASPEKKVKYVSAEQFTNEFIESIKAGGAKSSFKNKYRKVDVLLVDDLHVLIGKTGTQEEFFHTFNALYLEEKQIVLSCDRPPSAIPTLEDRLRSRFESGIIADIQPPDLETRTAILSNKAKLKGYDLPLEIIDYIARNIKQNVRELEGALNRLVAYAALNGEDVTIHMATQILGSSQSAMRRRSITPKSVLEKIAAFYDLSTDDLLGTRRVKEIVFPRQVAMYFLRQELNLSFPKIGSEFGGKDHTTVMHAVGKIEKQIDMDEPLRQEIALIKERLYVS